jgi:hypothetical protein
MPMIYFGAFNFVFKIPLTRICTFSHPQRLIAAEFADVISHVACFHEVFQSRIGSTETCLDGFVRTTYCYRSLSKV